MGNGFSCSYGCSVCDVGKPTFPHFHTEGTELTLLVGLACAKGGILPRPVILSPLLITQKERVSLQALAAHIHRCQPASADVWNSSQPSINEATCEWLREKCEAIQTQAHVSKLDLPLSRNTFFCRHKSAQKERNDWSTTVCRTTLCKVLWCSLNTGWI